MAMRALASATVSFGLVSIPVKLYSSSESSQTIRFNQIHKKDGSRLKQQMISAKSGDLVPKDEIVKGYEFAKGQYVLFSEEELKAIEEQATHTIDIAEFVPLDQIDRIYLDKVYFLGHDKGGARAYRLLAQALRKTGRAALAKYSARGKQYLVMVRPMEDGLVMEQLRYADEIRKFSEVPLEDATVKQEELQLAVQLVEQAASDEFHPENYKDEVRERTMELIQRKVDGEDITVTPTEEPEHKIIDMMEALKASIAAGGKVGAAKRKPAKRAEKKAGTGKKVAKGAS
ncbi:MAG: Ku protein [Gammaproteobacteria bacterium]|nr:Ku protein [Gammaproteobacteria bacterium]